MEQSNVENEVRGCVWSTGLTQDEREVVELLLEMRDMMLDLEADLRIPFQWGSKRKRSAIQVSVLPRLSSSAPPLNSGGGGGDSGEGGGGVAAAVVKGEASSPATPLSLSLTESDEKPNNNPLRIKASLKRKREYYLKIIEDLTKSKASLNQEIDNVKRYRGQLKAFNLKLKERRQELSSGPKSECKNPSLEIGCQTQLAHAPVNSSNSMAENQNHNKHHQLQLQVPNKPHCLRLRLNHTSGPPQLCSSEGIAQFQHVSSQPKTLLPMPPSSSPSASLATVNNSSSNMGPHGLPDLNVSPEEIIQVDSYQPLDVTMANKDLSRAVAAQARQRRIQINRLKNPMVNSKPRYSCR